MFGLLNLFSLRIDLDSSWINSIDFEAIAEGSAVGIDDSVRVSWKNYFAWYAVLLKQALDLQASAVVIQQSKIAIELLQFMCLEMDARGESSWHECASMWGARSQSGVWAARLIAGILPCRRHGAIKYVRSGVTYQAPCFFDPPGTVFICLSGTVNTHRRAFQRWIESRPMVRSNPESEMESE